jgi:peptide/nickel transport system permease protein
MKNFIIRRLLITLPILFGVSVLNFFIIMAVPGTPLDFVVSPRMTDEARAIIERNMGLDVPVYKQYLSWLSHFLRGDLGYSFSTSQPVVKVIGSRMGATLLLMGSSLVIGVLAAIPFGMISSIKPRSPFDYSATFAAFFGVSIPNFFLGLGLIYIFSVRLRLFPSSGMFTLGHAVTPGDVIRHMTLPAAVLSVNIAGRFIRYVRSAMLDALGQDYIRTAAAKGVSFFVRVSVHAFRNSLLPLITLLGLELPALLGGAVVTEQIFSWPGIGRLTMDAIASRDYPVLMALNMLAALMVVAASLLSDVLYALADPRIKYR